MLNRDLTKRTIGEELWIRRRWHGRTQAEAAKTYGVSERRYNLWETDREAPTGWQVHKLVPNHGDLCALARRRSGKDLRRLAKSMKVSHVTVLVWEKSGDGRLVELWKKRGYTFG